MIRRLREASRNEISFSDQLVYKFVTNLDCRRAYHTPFFVEQASQRFRTCGGDNKLPSTIYGYSNSSLKYMNAEKHSIYETESDAFEHWFKNWKEQRKCKLTASTFAGAVGFWKGRRTQLWLEKLGVIEPFSRSLATGWSNHNEEYALERYKMFTNAKILFPEFLQVYRGKSPDDDWLAASPDGVIHQLQYNLCPKGVLEIKCPFFNGDMSKASPWKRIPIHYIPQAQGLMEIMDSDWMHMYCWTTKGSSLFTIKRDPEYWEVLKIALSDFWWNHVIPAREECSKSRITDPIEQLDWLRPASRHENWREIICRTKQIVDNSELMMLEINGEILWPKPEDHFF